MNEAINLYLCSEQIGENFIFIAANPEALTSPKKVFSVILIFSGLIFIALIMSVFVKSKGNKIKPEKDSNIKNYLDKNIPSVFDPEKNIFSKLFEELKSKHEYFSSILGNNKNNNLVLIFKITTIQILLLFLLALLYDLQFPDDDGSCDNKTFNECFKKKSILDNHVTYCKWEDNSCLYNTPNFTPKVMVYAFILTSLFTSLFSVPIMKLFEYLECQSSEEKKIFDNLKNASMIMKRKTKINSILPDISFEKFDFFELKQKVFSQFQTLQEDKKNEYSSEWRITNYPEKEIGFIFDSIDSEKKELKEKFKNLSNYKIGKNLLNLFIIDLLGYKTCYAKIFKNKFEEDQESEKKSVSSKFKYFVVFLIFGINGFFIYYSLLKANSKNSKWQENFLSAAIIQFITEIFLFSTMECLWINFMIPSLLTEKINKIKEQIYFLEHDDQNKIYKYSLNAPAYLFLSNKLAKEYPDNEDSKMILSYKHYLPGMISEIWKEKNNSFLNRMFEYIIVLGSLPIYIQQIIIKIIQPIFLSCLILIWYYIVNNEIAVICGSIITFLSCLLLYKEWKTRSNNIKKIVNHEIKDDLYVDCEYSLSSSSNSFNISEETNSENISEETCEYNNIEEKDYSISDESMV